MRLATASIDALPAAIATWRPDAIVSAFSPSQPMQAPWDGPWLRLAFHDAEGLGRAPGPYLARPGMSPGAPLVLPSRAHIEALVAWVQAHRPKALMVTCRAGLGRSPALAIVAAVSSGIPALDAVHALARAVPEASPNRLILRHAEAVLGVAIVSHAEGAWDYRRGARGARGEATGLRGADTHPPHAGPPQGGQDLQAARGAGARSWEAKNGVPTPSGAAAGGLGAASTHPNSPGDPNQPAGLPGPRPSTFAPFVSIGSIEGIPFSSNGMTPFGNLSHAPIASGASESGDPSSEIPARGGDPGPRGGDHGGDPGPRGDRA